MPSIEARAKGTPEVHSAKDAGKSLILLPVRLVDLEGFEPSTA
jgi:hypothetical protein